MVIQNQGFSDFSDILDDEPRATFFSNQSRFGQGAKQRNFFQNQFQTIFDQFTGQIAQNIQQGDDPFHQQSFQDFLGQFSFNDRFRSLAPSVAGRGTRQLAPQATFRF